MSSDCLLWIDGPYKTVARFLAEAETRGCCRRMASWPSWVRPGETRVFLAHRDGHSRTDMGSIVGYFKLGGVGVLFDQGDYESYAALLDDFKAAPKGKADPKPLLEHWRAKGRRPPRDVPDDPIPDDDFLVDMVVDFLVDCDSTGGGSGYAISLDQTALEADRDCGDRSESGAVYFVDELARDIDSLFCEALKKILEKALEDDSRAGRRATGGMAVARLRERTDTSKGGSAGIAEFKTAVEKAGARRRSGTRVPANLARFTERRGATIVFERPYPSFQRIPLASFRNHLRIDGDELLRRIASARAGEGRRATIKLPYHRTPVGKRKTREQLIADLAEECQMSKAFASSTLGSVAELIDRELEERGWMTLTGVGTFRVEKVRGARRVHFEPSEGLKRRTGI